MLNLDLIYTIRVRSDVTIGESREKKDPCDSKQLSSSHIQNNKLQALQISCE